VSKRKKSAAPPTADVEENESVTTRATVSAEILEAARAGGVFAGDSAAADAAPASENEAPAPSVTATKKRPKKSARSRDADADALAVPADPDAASREPESLEIEFDVDPEEDEDGAFDAERTVNLVGDLPLPGRDDLDAPTVTASGDAMEEVDRLLDQRKHLRGLVEALIFASDSPIQPKDIARLAQASARQVKDVLDELQQDYATRGIHLDEVAGGWLFRTSARYAPFVRDLTKQKPVRLTRAQVETLAIIAYRQPITRPEIDDVRGVDSGPVLKVLLERDLVRILGKRDEPGRPMIYGTTNVFLEFFGLRSLKDLPTLREFTELTDESREAFEDELGESPDNIVRDPGNDTDAAADMEPAPLGDEVEEALEELAGEGEADEITDAGVDLGDDDAGDVHQADEDGPTLTSEAPSDDDE